MVDRKKGPRALTNRELEVLRLLADGLSTVEIARRLWLARDTVRSHVASASRALEAHGRAHAIALCFERGLFGACRCADQQAGDDRDQ